MLNLLSFWGNISKGTVVDYISCSFSPWTFTALGVWSSFPAKLLSEVLQQLLAAASEDLRSGQIETEREKGLWYFCNQLSFSTIWDICNLKTSTNRMDFWWVCENLFCAPFLIRVQSACLSQHKGLRIMVRTSEWSIWSKSVWPGVALFSPGMCTKHHFRSHGINDVIFLKMF